MLGTRIRQLRKEFGFTLDTVAKTVGVNHSSISAYEKGTRIPTIKVLKNLSECFDVSVDYLLGTSNERSNKYAIASYNGLKTAMEDLTEADIEEVSRFIQFIKSKKE